MFREEIVRGNACHFNLVEKLTEIFFHAGSYVKSVSDLPET